LVRQAQVSLPNEYHVFSVEDGKADVPVTVVNKRVPAPRLAIMSITLPNNEAWAPGTYMLVVPGAGLAPDDTWVFFYVQPK